MNKKAQQPATDKEEDESNKIYLTHNSTLQTPEEEAADKSRKTGKKEDRIETHTTRDVDIDALAGPDRVGTSERKP